MGCIKTCATALLFSLLSASQTSIASSSNENDKLRFAGFASFVYAKALDNSTETNTVSQQPVSGLRGITEDGEYRDFNKFGFRLDADLDHKLSFAAQLFVKGQTDYEAEFDWIYLSYEITPSVNLFVGRMILPLYLYSDYFDVAYAYQWITPPDSIYDGGNNVKTGEGARITWRSDMGANWSSLLTAWTGKSEQKIGSVQTVTTVDNAVGVTWEIERRWITLKMLYSTALISADARSVTDSIQRLANQQLLAAGVSNPEINQLDSFNNILWKNDRADFISLGVNLDFEYFFSSAEITNARYRDDADNFAGNWLNSWYVMVGTRLPQNWSIAFTYSEDNDKLNEQLTQTLGQSFIDEWGSQGSQEASDSQLQAIANSLEPIFIETQSRRTQNYILGSRWDFHPKAAFKMEYLYSRIASGNTPLRKPSAFRLGVDVIF